MVTGLLLGPAYRISVRSIGRRYDKFLSLLVSATTQVGGEVRLGDSETGRQWDWLHEHFNINFALTRLNILATTDCLNDFKKRVQPT
jgi:hypothetical protein